MTTRQHPEPRRFAKEAELMSEHTEARLVQGRDGSCQWVERLLSEGGQPYTLLIEYPPRFPHERPKAFVLEPAIEHAPHMFPDGSLCLFSNPWETDPNCTALVIRNRAVTWMLGFEVWKGTGRPWTLPEHGSTGVVP